jgi:hypothetical protein
MIDLGDLAYLSGVLAAPFFLCPVELAARS